MFWQKCRDQPFRLHGCEATCTISAASTQKLISAKLQIAIVQRNQPVPESPPEPLQCEHCLGRHPQLPDPFLLPDLIMASRSLLGSLGGCSSSQLDHGLKSHQKTCQTIIIFSTFWRESAKLVKYSSKRKTQLKKLDISSRRSFLAAKRQHIK